MRKVIVFRKIWPDGYNKTPVMVEQFRGKFHCWGSSYEEFESGPGNYTIGIVELDDGHVITAIPELIQFLPEE